MKVVVAHATQQINKDCQQQKKQKQTKDMNVKLINKPIAFGILVQ